MILDRAAYVAYLESQLECVTTACLTRNKFDERIEAACARLQDIEAKVFHNFKALLPLT